MQSTLLLKFSYFSSLKIKKKDWKISNIENVKIGTFEFVMKWFERDAHLYKPSDVGKNKEKGLVNFFCHDRHPQTDFLGCI